MKIFVTPSQQAAARLKLRLAQGLTSRELKRLSAIADARRVRRENVDVPPVDAPPAQ